MFVLGINTGTSVDGVDLSLVKWDINNLRNFEIVREVSYEFDPGVKKEIQTLISKQKCYLEEVSDLSFKFTKFISFLVQEFIKENSEFNIDLIGFHGQTIFHGEKSTWQIGNPSILAKLTGITTIGDFRPADMAVGGCGAPISSFLDDQLIRSNTETLATLNIGGIANISVMELEKDTLAYDTGPGNTLIDVLVKKLFHKDFDEDGSIATEGKIDHKFLENLVARTEYFEQLPPKSTGRELFCEKYADKFLDLGNKENIVATASYFTVMTISHELQKYPLGKVYVSGGGVQNKFLMTKLREANPDIQFLNHNEFRIKSQYKEAMLFSLLAFTSFNNIPNNIPSSTGAKRATILGVIARP